MIESREKPGTRQPLRETLLPVAGLVLLALLTRLPALGSRPMWYDEAFSVLFSHTGPVNMLRGTLTVAAGGISDVHPLLYYSLLWVWTHLFGSSVLMVRLLSVVISLITLVLGFAFVRRLLSTRAAVVVGVLIALSPFQIQYAQEARMYGLLSLWIIACAFLAWIGCQEDARWPWVAFGVCSALAMYTHALAAVSLAPLVITPLWFRRRDRMRWMVLGVLIAIVLYLPWGLQLPGQFAKVARAYWVEQPSAVSLIQTLLGFVTGLPLEGISLILGLFLAISLVVLLGLQVWRIIRLRADACRELIWLAYLVIAPVVLLFLVSQWQPVFIVRALLPSGLMLLLLTGGVLAHAATRRAAQVFIGVTIVAACILGQVAHFRYVGFPYAPYEEIGTYLEESTGEGDLILHSNKLTMLPQTYYFPALPQTYLADPPGSGSDTLARPTQEVLGLLAEPDALTAVRDSQRVFFIIFQRELDEYARAGFDAPPGLTWLQTYYDQRKVSGWGDLKLYLFTLKEAPLGARVDGRW